jgi:hypothetical protein
VPTSAHAPLRSSSPSSAVGKHHFKVGVGRSPARGLGQCGKRLVYGDRCPDCARKLRERKRRKPR